MTLTNREQARIRVHNLMTAYKPRLLTTDIDSTAAADNSEFYTAISRLDVSFSAKNLQRECCWVARAHHRIGFCSGLWLKQFTHYAWFQFTAGAKNVINLNNKIVTSSNNVVLINQLIWNHVSKMCKIIYIFDRIISIIIIIYIIIIVNITQSMTYEWSTLYN